MTAIPARPIQRIRSSSYPVSEARDSSVELPAPPGEALSNEPVKQRPADQAGPNGGHYRVRDRRPERIRERDGEDYPQENARDQERGCESHVIPRQRDAANREHEYDDGED